MQRTNRNVSRALASFERKRRPKIDDATSVTFDIQKKPAGAVAFLKTSFASSQIVASSGSVEVISIPTYSAPGEWQGTILVYQYNAAGHFVNEYIADVILLPDPTYTYWDAILEVSYDWEGVWLQHGTLELFNEMGTPQGGWPATSGSLGRLKSKPQFQIASFPQAGTRPIFVPQPNFPFPSWARVKRALKCAGKGCGYAAVACGVGSALFAEAPFAPCFTTTCVGVSLYCLIETP